MLKDPEEIKIISKARQKNIRDPKRSRDHFYRIFDDFFQDISFEGRLYLDLGAGQFDFCEMIRDKKGHCIGIDNDPAVINLGQFKGFNAIEFNIKNVHELSIQNKFDGIFNKFTLNAFWFWSDKLRHKLFV